MSFLAVALVVCCMGSVPAYGATIAYDYTATVTAVTGLPGLSVGDTVFGVMSYQNVSPYGPFVPDLDPDPRVGYWGHIAERLSIFFGPYWYEGHSGRLLVYDNWPTGDSFYVFHDSGINNTPWFRADASFSLFGPAHIFASDALPPDLGNFSDWSGGTLRFAFIFLAPGEPARNFQAQITSLSLPEPTTVILVAAGLGALFSRQRNRLEKRARRL